MYTEFYIFLMAFASGVSTIVAFGNYALGVYPLVALWAIIGVFSRYRRTMFGIDYATEITSIAVLSVIGGKVGAFSFAAYFIAAYLSSMANMYLSQRRIRSFAVGKPMSPRKHWFFGYAK